MNPERRRPRVVLVTRRSPLESLLDRHGTIGQARFYLESRGQRIEPYHEAHDRFEAGLADVMRSLPADQRRARVDRGELDRFLFADDDIVVVVGQDGLISNAAKYLRGQLAIGINPDPTRNDGVLCRHRPADAPRLFKWLDAPSADAYHVERRIMAAAQREDGQRLLALNEIFVGHRTHQSARYRIRVDGKEERQSSSGVICATGTGGTGWAASIARQRDLARQIPSPEMKRLVWFVREPFPSVFTGVRFDFGLIDDAGAMEIVSEMGADGVIFADGIESDRLEFVDGQSVRLSIAIQTLNLVVPTEPREPARNGREPH